MAENEAAHRRLLETSSKRSSLCRPPRSPACGGHSRFALDIYCQLPAVREGNQDAGFSGGLEIEENVDAVLTLIYRTTAASSTTATAGLRGRLDA